MPSKLRALIKSRGFTITSFGSKLEITREGVYDILKRKYLKPDLIEKLCKVLATQPEEFIEYNYPDGVKEKLYKQTIADLEKKNQELQNENSELKNKVIALHERLDRKREQFEKHIERRMDKMLAAVLTTKKN